MAHRADDYIFLSESKRCGVVIGLPEEVTAMLFAFYSRSDRTVMQALQSMIDNGDLDHVEPPSVSSSDRARRFHEKHTIGYGHKSVADHAVCHLFVEGASMVAERNFTSARLMAFTAKSTRFVDFSKVGHRSLDGRDDLSSEQFELYEQHIRTAIYEYTHLIPIAVDAVRSMCLYDSSQWTQKAWESATEKRALDIVRGMLPCATETSWGMSGTATAIREMLDKRSTSPDREIRELASELRQVARIALPTLIPSLERGIEWHNPSPPCPETYDNKRIHVQSVPNWRSIERLTGIDMIRLAEMFEKERYHHMPPNRYAEFAIYTMVGTMGFGIARDLGRHRMMTQVWSDPDPKRMGIDIDPIFIDENRLKYPLLAKLRMARMEGIALYQERLKNLGDMGLSGKYACIMDSLVDGRWAANLRELFHICGLRTTQQGHASYRYFVQLMVQYICLKDKIGGPMLRSVTNFEEVLVGRPG